MAFDDGRTKATGGLEYDRLGPTSQAKTLAFTEGFAGQSVTLGAGRTGRTFTGDRSGEFLYRALYEAGFASQPESRHRDDRLRLINCYITASIRCAPPANKPLPKELANCQPYFEKELQLLKNLRAVLALGRIAFDTFLRVVWNPRVFPPRATLRFAHGANCELPGELPRLFASYHPSQQNTQTGRLTPPMFRQVLTDIRQYLASAPPLNLPDS